MELSNDLADQLRQRLSGDAYWEHKLDPADGERPVYHLAIFVSPYLELVLSGDKTIESRSSVRSVAPYGKVTSGDVVLVKKAAGGVVALFEVGEVWSFDGAPETVDDIRQRFEDGLCAQPGLWTKIATARFVTLLKVERIKRILPLSISKRDRRGWVVMAFAPA